MGATCCADEEDLDRRLRGPSALFVVMCLALLYTGVCGTLSFFLGATGLFVCVLQVLFAVMLASEQLERQHPAAQWLLIVGGALAATAAAVGVCNYHALYAPYLDGTAGRSYTDLRADAQASAHLDGGVLHFDDDALLDTTRAIGLRSHGHTYCAAPVLGRQRVEADRVLPVQFWAIGIDCCAPRGDFQCGGAGKENAHGGFVLHEYEELTRSGLFAPRTHHEEYLRAVEAAAALHHLPSADPPLLVQWTASPEHVLHLWLEGAIFNWGFTSVLASVVAALVWCPVQLHYDAKIRGAAQAIYQPRAGPNYGATKTTAQLSEDPFLLNNSRAP